MWYYNTYWCWIPNCERDYIFIKEKSKEQKRRTKDNRAESFVRWYLNEIKKKENIKYKLQNPYLWKIFDFWFPSKWVRIEVDWNSHNEDSKKNDDKNRDEFLFKEHWIITLRCKNWDKWSTYTALCEMRKASSWLDRKQSMWLHVPEEWKEDNTNDIVSFCENLSINDIKSIINVKID